MLPSVTKWRSVWSRQAKSLVSRFNCKEIQATNTLEQPECIGGNNHVTIINSEVLKTLVAEAFPEF